MKVKELLKLLGQHSIITIFDEFGRNIVKIEPIADFNNILSDLQLQDLEVKEYHVLNHYGDFNEPHQYAHILLVIHGALLTPIDVKRYNIPDIDKYKLKNVLDCMLALYDAHAIIQQELMNKYNINIAQQFYIANNDGFVFTNDIFWFDSDLNLYKNDERVVFDEDIIKQESYSYISVIDILSGEIVTDIEKFYGEGKYGKRVGTVTDISTESVEDGLAKRVVYYSSSFDERVLSVGDYVYIVDPYYPYISSNSDKEAYIAVCEKIFDVACGDDIFTTVAKFVTSEPLIRRTVSKSQMAKLGFDIRMFTKPKKKTYKTNPSTSNTVSSRKRDAKGRFLPNE